MPNLKYPLLDAMLIEYAVLHALEAGSVTTKQVRALLNAEPARGRIKSFGVCQPLVTANQITGALQRLKRQGLVANDAHDWKRVRGAA